MSAAFSTTKNSSSPVRPEQLTKLARQVGFAEAGWADSNSLEAIKGYQEWIKAKRYGPLDYLANHQHLREDPKQLLEGGGVGFIVLLLPLVWMEGRSDQMEKGKGWIARYAQGRDYHKVMRKQLTRLLDLLREEFSPTLRGRALVDSAPVLERDLAQVAGLGWIGKNGLLLSKNWGSHILIGSLLIDQVLPMTEVSKKAKNHCGHHRS
jgi:epoxyqueuosine reductase